MVWFPALVLIFLVAMTALGISGTSSGVLWGIFGEGSRDPSLLLGQPRPIRSDEWLAQGSWMVSQVEHGLPSTNPALPGGMNVTIFNDAPTRDWGTIFRPHLLGYRLLPLDQAAALRWWIPGLAIMIAAYLFAVTLMPRRPISSALLAVAFFFTPIFQWWYLPANLWPAALAALTMAATMWVMRDPRLRVRIAWSAGAGYVGVTAAMSMYVPFLIAAMMPAGLVVLGTIASEGSRQRLALRALLRRLLPLIAATVVAIGIVGVWLATRLSVVHAVLDTVYPGQRLVPPGGLRGSGLARLFAGPFEESLRNQEGSYLAGNQSEASSSTLWALFLVPAMVWLIAAGWRERRRLDWLVLSVIAGCALTAAYLFVPGWDPIAHVMFLDRTSIERMFLAVPILGLAAIVVTVRRIDERERPIPWLAGLSACAVAAASIFFVALALHIKDPAVLAAATHWRLNAVLIVLAVFFLVRARPAAAAALIFVSAVIIAGTVNPWYRGVMDLRDTAPGEAIQTIDEQSPGTWIAIGPGALTALLLESGAELYGGTQSYPVREMWQEIDPSGQYEQQWNRLAHVAWVPGPGEPVLTNPVPDTIEMNFDSCSAFAQRYVKYVVSLESKPIQQTCLTPIKTVTDVNEPIVIYEVT